MSGSGMSTVHTPSVPLSASVTWQVGRVYADWSTVAPLAGAVHVTVGATRSMLITRDTSDVTLSAASTTDTETVWPAPSVDTTVGAGHTTPDRSGPQVTVTVTGVLFQSARVRRQVGGDGRVGCRQVEVHRHRAGAAVARGIARRRRGDHASETLGRDGARAAAVVAPGSSVDHTT